ncbi:MAG: lysylphosphatidylglycerol synthase transmembrane domain-containing protein [Dehalococcoidia bacterium]
MLARKARYWIGGLASIVFLGLFVLRTDVDKAIDALLEADYIYLAPAIAVFFVSVWFRSWRWATILRPFLVIRVHHLYPYVVIGSMVNNVLPARAGELVRTYVLGQRYGVKKMTVLGTVAIDRLFDGIALLGIYVVVAFASDTNNLLTWIAVVGALAFGVVTALFLTLVYRPDLAQRPIDAVVRRAPLRIRDKLATSVDLFIKGLQPLRSPIIIGSVLTLSLIAWFCETSMYYILGFAFDLDQPFHVYLLVAAAANLVIALPPSQGGIGPFELVAREVLVLAGVGASTASAYALALHAALLLPVIVAGLVFLWLVNLNIGRVLRADAEQGLLSETPG